MIHYTADLHFDHDNIIKYCERPFKDVATMNEVLIRNWNQRVKACDTVYHIGDFAYKNKWPPYEFERKLNGKIIFILGNHDKNNKLKTNLSKAIITQANKTIELVHVPQHSSMRCDLTFCGHVHTSWKFRTYPIARGHENIFINVGTDAWKFMPVTFDEIIGQYYKWDNQRKRIAEEKGEAIATSKEV